MVLESKRLHADSRGVSTQSPWVPDRLAITFALPIENGFCLQPLRESAFITIREQGQAEAIEKKDTAQSEIASFRKFADSRETDF